MSGRATEALVHNRTPGVNSNTSMGDRIWTRTGKDIDINPFTRD